jgi:hypothetical protein
LRREDESDSDAVGDELSRLADGLRPGELHLDLGELDYLIT